MDDPMSEASLRVALGGGPPPRPALEGTLPRRDVRDVEHTNHDTILMGRD